MFGAPKRQERGFRGPGSPPCLRVRSLVLALVSLPFKNTKCNQARPPPQPHTSKPAPPTPNPAMRDAGCPLAHARAARISWGRGSGGWRLTSWPCLAAGCRLQIAASSQLISYYRQLCISITSHPFTCTKCTLRHLSTASSFPMRAPNCAPTPTPPPAPPSFSTPK